MILIDINNDPKQTIQVPFNDGTATIGVWYSTANNCWFMSVSYGTNTVNNILIDQGVNLTYPFRHMFPFGIICISDSGLRPLYLDSFETAEADLILLNPEENFNI